MTDLLIALAILVVPATLALRRRRLWGPHKSDYVIAVEQLSDDMRQVTLDITEAIRPAVERFHQNFMKWWDSVPEDAKKYVDDFARQNRKTP